MLAQQRGVSPDAKWSLFLLPTARVGADDGEDAMKLSTSENVRSQKTANLVYAARQLFVVCFAFSEVEFVDPDFLHRI